jgi:hypothetical protein
MFRALVIIGPLMAIETFTAIQLIVRIGDFELHRLIRADLAILLSIWLITLIFELPLHISILSGSASSSVVGSLVVTNFFRMVLWITKSYLVTKMIPCFYLQK